MQQRWVAAAMTGVACITAIAVDWNTLGWSRPAFTSDIKELDQKLDDNTATVEANIVELRSLVLANTRRILQNDWWRYDKEVEEITDLLLERPDDQRLKNTLRRLRRERSEIEADLKKLDEDL